jgi:phosphoribosyl 1,2-cyclic phosphate phosphodiesterase
MDQEGSFTLLGTGASAGVPMIGCSCAVCQSTDPNDRRLRCSAWIQTGDVSLLIDPGPDLREQALIHRIEDLNGVLITHTHYDHIAGIDELRAYYFRSRRPLPCLVSKHSYADLQTRYHYMFRPKTHGRSFPAQIDFQQIPDERGSLSFQGVPLQYVTYDHSGMKVTGYRLGDLAYICDIRDYPETVIDDLQGVRTLIVSALRQEPSPIHFTVTEAVAFAQRVGVEQTWLTHISHEIGHAETNAELPPNVRMGYDGLHLNWNYAS